MSALEHATRPSRTEIEPAALDLIRSHGAQIMSVARRYAASPEDAEDAYQRGLEILLTKAPSTHPDDLVPWLKTVVKHEAFNLRRQRERSGMPSEYEDSRPAPGETHEHVERLDQLQRGAEALHRLKPAEIRCLLLLAEGYSYRQICEITGFTYTKVNRSLAEGRRSFLQGVAGIEAGAECRRLAPLISAAADGEASGDDMLALRRHMRGCLACRAALREARQVPARVAALAPAGLVFVAPSGGGGGSFSGWLHDHVASLAVRGQDVVEATAMHKAVAVAASAAALAGGGFAVVQVAQRGEPVHAQRAAAVVQPEAAAPASALEPPVRRFLPVGKPAPEKANRRAHREQKPPEPEPPTPTPAPTPAPAPAPAPAADAAPSSYGAAPTPAPAPSGGGSSTGEFGP